MKYYRKFDRVVSEKKISRNRFIIEACEKALENNAGEWPKGFFNHQMGDEELRLLTEAGLEMESAIFCSRKTGQLTDGALIFSLQISR